MDPKIFNLYIRMLKRSPAFYIWWYIGDKGIIDYSWFVDKYKVK